MTEQKQEQTLEELFGQLEKILETLENSEATLEESFANYQKGMELIKQCNQKIDLVEKKMQLMNEEGGLSDF